MRKTDWYTYLKWPQDQKEAYPFTLLNKDNEVQCYELSEQKKYKAALRRRKEKDV